TSAVSWANDGVTHSALYAIDKNDSVEISVDGGGFTSLGGYAKQVSAGLNSSGNPVVYEIGSDNAVWYYRPRRSGSSWVSLGGYAKQISATVQNTVYEIGSNDDVWVNHGSGWVSLGGYAKQISAGTDGNGNPEVFAIGYNDTVSVNNGSGWVNLGGYAK